MNINFKHQRLHVQKRSPAEVTESNEVVSEKSMAELQLEDPLTLRL